MFCHCWRVLGGRADSKAYHDFAAPRTSSWRHFSHAFSSLSPVREAVLFQDPQWELLRHYVSSCIIHQAGLQHFSKTSGHPLALFPTTKHWSASLFRDYERRNGEGLPSLPHQGLSEFSLREEPTTCGLTDWRSKSLGKGVGRAGAQNALICMRKDQD